MNNYLEITERIADSEIRLKELEHEIAELRREQKDIRYKENNGLARVYTKLYITPEEKTTKKYVLAIKRDQAAKLSGDEVFCSPKKEKLCNKITELIDELTSLLKNMKENT